MTSREYEILKILADGNNHSGQELADRAGISRSAVWKHLNSIRQKAIQVRAVRGRGYQLVDPVELLDIDQISKYLDPGTPGTGSNIDILYEINSTNQFLLQELASAPVQGHIVMAEYQFQGRGRGNTRWECGLGAGLYLSLGWQFNLAPKTFPALSLAVGTVISESISGLGGISIGLKWPNDLVFQGSKLGGILIESRGQLAGRLDVVIGVGININLSENIRHKIRQEVTDIHSVFGFIPSRNELAGIIISKILNLLSEYPDVGFGKYLEDWRKRDISRGKNARLNLSGGVIEGTVVDVDEEGNLIMSVNGSLEKFISGDLSLRISN